MNAYFQKTLNKELYINASSVISNGAVYKNEIRIFENTHEEISRFLIFVYKFLEADYPKFYKMDNLAKLGWLANEILLKDCEVILEQKPEDTGVVLWNANASLDTDLKYFNTVASMASPALFVYTLPNIMIGEICIKHRFKGENAFFVSEGFDGNFMKDYVSNLINNNILQSCICGWVDLLGENGKAVLFLVQNQPDENARPFTEDTINNIYQISNG